MEPRSSLGGRGDRGAVAVVVAVFLVVFMVLVAFVVDLGRVYVRKAELQNAVDAGALAGAQALPGSPSNAMSYARSFAETNGVPVGNAGALAPYNGDPCAVLATGTDRVSFIFGGFVGLSGQNISARAVGARDCSVAYNVYGQVQVTYNGANSTGAYLYAGDRFVYNGTGIQLTDVDNPTNGCVDPLFGGIWVKGARTGDTSDPIDSGNDLEETLFECNGTKLNNSDVPSGDEISALPSSVKHYNFSPPNAELTALAYGDSLGLGPAATLNAALNTAPSRPINSGATGATCASRNSTSGSYYCTGDLPAGGNLSIGAVSSPIGATGDVSATSGSGPSAKSLTLASGFVASVFAGGNITGLTFPDGYTASIVAGGDITSISVPSGYSGTIWAGDDIDTVTVRSPGVFNGVIVAGAVSGSGDIKDFQPTSCAACTIWANSISGTTALPAGFTGSLYLNTSSNTNLTLPSAFRGIVASKSRLTVNGQTGGVGSYATCSGASRASGCGLVYSSSRTTAAASQSQCSDSSWGATETTSITTGSGGLVTNAYLWAPCGNVVLADSATRTKSPVIGYSVTYNGGSITPVTGGSQLVNFGDVRLSE